MLNSLLNHTMELLLRTEVYAITILTGILRNNFGHAVQFQLGHKLTNVTICQGSSRNGSFKENKKLKQFSSCF